MGKAMRVFRVEINDGELSMGIIETIGDAPSSLGNIMEGWDKKMPGWVSTRLAVLKIAKVTQDEKSKQQRYVEVDGVGVAYTSMEVYRIVPPPGVIL